MDIDGLKMDIDDCAEVETLEANEAFVRGVRGQN